MTDEQPKSGISVYDGLLKEEIEAENARKTSFEARGLAVITSSGGLATLLFGLAALSTKEQATFVLPDDSGTLLGFALAAFVVAAALGLFTNVPQDYETVTAEGIQERVDEIPPRDEDAATTDVAYTRITVLKDARIKNTNKAKLLFWALVFEVVAVLCVGVAVWIVINA